MSTGDDVADLSFADSAYESLCATAARYSANFDFWLAKCGRFARVDNIAQHGEFKPSTKLREFVLSVVPRNNRE